MTDDAEVEYTLVAFRRAKFVEGGKVLRLETDLADDVAFPAFDAAAQAVTDHFEEREAVDDVYVRLGGVVPGPSGPMVPVPECEPSKALPRMLERLSEELSTRGVSGRLVPVKTVMDKHFGNNSFPTLGMVFCPLVDTDPMYAEIDEWPLGLPMLGVWADPVRLRRIMTVLVEWATQVEGQILVGVINLIEMGREALVDYMCSALAYDNMLIMNVTSKDNTRRREVAFLNLDVIVTDYAPERSRGDQLASLTELATDLAPDVANLLVRELFTGTRLTETLGRTPPTVELFRSLDSHVTTTTAHLRDDYVLDAGVAQVLTSSQLMKARLDPTRWEVRDLGNERHLVTHRAPEAWLDPDPDRPQEARRDALTWPSPNVVADARADFGDAILSLEAIRAHPAPITAEQASSSPGFRWILKALGN